MITFLNADHFQVVAQPRTDHGANRCVHSGTIAAAGQYCYALPGVSAAIGWVLMVIYVLVIDPSNNMITRDYIEYMTSNSVLIGAEFDKIVSILMVTGVLALALHRARNLLVESVIEGIFTTN